MILRFFKNPLLLPNTLPHTNILDHHIEEEYIPHYRSKEGKEDRIDDFFTFALHSIECTDPLRSEIPYETDDETEESKYSKVPLIVSIKSIRERSGEGDAPKSERNDDD